jgi:Uma2 family endonuclease
MLNYQRQPVLLSFSLPVAVPLPDPSELPDSDDTPVDNDLQTEIPNLLRQSLKLHWRHRHDYYFGINIGIYHNTPGFSPRKPIVPDGFLSLGVAPTSDEGRPSYIVWQEDNIMPILVLECVSKTYGGEYDDKMTCYRCMGVLYYIIYNPHRYHSDSHAVLEVYRQVKGKYQRQRGPRVWLPELNLSVGREVGEFDSWEREWLYWYDSEGRRLLPPAERMEQERHRADQERQRADQEQQRADQERQRADQEQQRAEHAEHRVAEEQHRADQERQRAERLAALLRAQGLDPDQLS